MMTEANKSAAAPPPVKGRAGTKSAKETPTTPPTETLAVQWVVKVSDTDIALTAPSTTATAGCPLKIDDEWMTVKNLTNMDNLPVDRGAFGSTPAQHEAGAAVAIYGTVSGIAPGIPAPPSEEEVKEHALSGYRATALQGMNPGETEEGYAARMAEQQATNEQQRKDAATETKKLMDARNKQDVAVAKK